VKRLPDPTASSAAVSPKAAVVSKFTGRLVPLARYGFAAGVFFAGYVLLQLPSNIALYRIGARRWIAALMVFVMESFHSVLA
jgi:hypothetical protein